MKEYEYTKEYKHKRVILWILIMTIIIIAGSNIWQYCQEKKEERGEGKEMRQYELVNMLKIPTVEEVSDNPYIYRYNHKLAMEKGLTDEDRLSNYYLCMQAVYRANLEAYLLEVLDIKKLDEELKDNELGFTSHKPENKNLYEKESMMELEFIYLRNNLCIEYLDKEQLKLLDYQLKEEREAVTSELKSMVSETYPEIIKVRDLEGGKEQRSFLYSEIQGGKPKIPNQALVLEIVNSWEYDASGNLLTEDNMQEKCDYLEKIKERKEKEYSEILETEVYILLE